MKRQNVGFLSVGLVVGLLIGSIYSQQPAIAANVQGRGKLVNGWSDAYRVFRMWEDGTVESRVPNTASQWAPLPSPN